MAVVVKICCLVTEDTVPRAAEQFCQNDEISTIDTGGGVDVAAHDWEAKQAAVLETLAMLGATGIPRLTLYNKADLVDRTAFVPLVAATGGELVSVMDGEDRYAVRSFVEDRLRS